MTPAQRRLGGLAGAAALIAGVTLLARITGVGRWFVFSGSVGQGCTGTAYSAANLLPNVLFEVVAGGALAGAVVPVLAGLLSTGRRADADHTASVLLTWVVVGLLPFSLLLGALAGPLSRLLLAGRTEADCGTATIELAARMLVVFAPQVLLYGVGIVLTGVLQAHHRFTGPAVAPLLSSVVVIGAYLGFGWLHGTSALPDRGAELVLSVGTTLGVVALSLPLVVPVLAAGVRLRPAWRLPAGVGARLRVLALAGIGALLAQQAAVLATIALANRVGGAGALVVVQYAQAVYLLPYAVLAVPIATAAFPRLSEYAAQDRPDEFASAAARSTRAVLWAGLLGAAVLAASAPGVQALFAALDVGGGRALTALAEALTWFAVGLVGWGLVAQISRALYALDRGRAAALATAAGWAVVVLASVGAVAGLTAAGIRPERAAVVGLAVGTSAGMLLAGGLLLVALRSAAGPAAVHGVGRALVVGAAAALVAAVAGRLLVDPPAVTARGRAEALAATGASVASAVIALAGFAVVVWLTEPGPRRLLPGVQPRVAQVLATSGGGVGRHVAALATWLVGVGGVPVRVAGPAATDAAFGLSGTGAGFVPVEIADRPRPGADLAALLRLRGLAGEVDVLHAHGLRAGALAVLAGRSRRRRPRIVVTLHNALVGGRGVAVVHGLLARIVARGADAVLVVSGDLGEQVRALGARRVARALVPAPPFPPRPAGPASPAATRALLGVAEGEFLLVTVARLAPQKGLPLLLAALSSLVERGIGVRAVLAGDGPLHAELSAEVARRGLPLALLGRRADVPDLLAAADLVVVPSVWEGQPLVVQEALRAPAAIVATDVGGVGETAGDGAVLVPAGDAAALAAAVARLLADPGERARLRARAAARAAALPTDDDAGRQVLAVYAAALNGWSSGWPPAWQPGLRSGSAGAADTLKARGAADSS